ncbi:4Fe-4S binding protein [Candidatus Peregrinibacteria bacterium]|jgi:dihydroorotate dehydrogenase/ferredoxin|nr:4Fe-4S binding protein [Candidatus Peregrinibacteria bacterium]MBT7484191.1 4Fe-4S binding protein [Candidatus Peregrinibacteria bacterium]MBT7703157.1 4Fe-4S binding protein [Candidatus Peregrinibacteria bacterium]
MSECPTANICGYEIPLIGVASGPHTASIKPIAEFTGHASDGRDLDIDKDSPITQRGIQPFLAMKTMGGGPSRGAEALDSIREPDTRRIMMRAGVSMNCETSFAGRFKQEYLPLLEQALKTNSPLFISVGYEADEIERNIREIKNFLTLFTGLPPIFFEVSLHHSKDDPNKARDRVRAAVKAAGWIYPVFVKISYYDGHYLEIAQMIKEEGAAGIVGINSLGPYDSQRMLAEEEGWLAGLPLSEISPLICRRVKETLGADYPYIAVGGVTTHNIQEYFENGADAVEACTHFLAHGPEEGLMMLHDALQENAVQARCRVADTFKNLEQEIARRHKGIGRYVETLGQFFATNIDLGRSPELHSLTEPLTLSLNEESCTGCMDCMDACGSRAITPLVVAEGLESRAFPDVDPELCEDCSLCVTVCPNGALTLKEIE